MGMIAEIKTKPKLALGLVFIVILMITVIIVNLGFIKDFWPSEEGIQNEIKKLKIAQGKLAEKLNEKAQIKHERDVFIAGQDVYWLTERDGRVETELRKKIEIAAKSSGIQLSTLGNIRSSKIDDGLKWVMVRVGAKTSMESITRFMDILSRTKPDFHWESCSLRPDNLRNPRMVTFDATLKIICIDNGEISKILMKESK